MWKKWNLPLKFIYLIIKTWKKIFYSNKFTVQRVLNYGFIKYRNKTLELPPVKIKARRRDCRVRYMWTFCSVPLSRGFNR